MNDVMDIWREGKGKVIEIPVLIFPHISNREVFLPFVQRALNALTEGLERGYPIIVEKINFVPLYRIHFVALEISLHPSQMFLQV